MILGPKPPPMNGATTRTCRGDRPSIEARPPRIGMGACVVSHTVSCSARASHSRDHAAVLHRRRAAAVVAEAARDADGGAGARRRVVALALDRVSGQVRLEVIVHQRRAGLKRRFEVDHRVERVGVEHHVGGGVLGQVATVGHHHRDRLADVAHLAARERHLRARVKDDAFDRRRRHQ